ncbi:head GIN domain-containing protein [Chitinophaga sancti]|uniref:head GIN domain-containing protein n=1 Tax=Chitinophaga sancti TaxID=1004 RepID=UPI003F7A4B31
MKTTAIAFLMLMLASVNVFAQKDRITGSGTIKKESRSASAFKSIAASGSFNVYITPGSGTNIEIEADDNLLPYIVTDIENGELQLHVKKGYDIKPTQKITVNVSMAEIKELAASGSGGFYSKGTLKGDKVELGISGSVIIDMDLNAEKLEIGVSGSTKIALRGNVTKVEYGISGSASVDALALKSENVEVGVSGSGDLAVNAEKKLDISVSGGAKIRYKGNPSINQSSSGSSKVTKID